MKAASEKALNAPGGVSGMEHAAGQHEGVSIERAEGEVWMLVPILLL